MTSSGSVLTPRRVRRGSRRRARAGAEGDGEVGGAADEVGGQPLRVPGRGEVFEAGEDLAQQRVYLDARDVRTEAELRTAATEGHVVVRRAAQVELVRPVEHLGYAVGGAVVHDHPVALRDRHTAQ